MLFYCFVNVHLMYWYIICDCMHKKAHDWKINTILFYSIIFYSIIFYSILFYSILFYSILFVTFDQLEIRTRHVLNCGRICGQHEIRWKLRTTYTKKDYQFLRTLYRKKETPQSPVHCTEFCNLRILRLDLDIF